MLLLAHLPTPATAHVRQLVGTKQNVLLPETGTIISYVSTLTGQIQKHVCYIQCCGYGSESSSGSNLFYYPAQNCQLIFLITAPELVSRRVCYLARCSEETDL